MMAVVEHHQVAVKSGHKIGKSLLVAILALWWACCWPDGKVLITAPTADQIKDIVWAEVRKLATRAREIGRVHVPDAGLDPSTGIRWDDGRRIIGRSTDKAERIQGYSGPACLYLIDEASGVAKDIFEALQGNTAGGSDDDESAIAKFVLTGNPTQVSGEFYDAFNRNKRFWRTFTISSEETPNAKAGKVLIPGLATADYVRKKKAAWGEDSDLYRMRVAGKFPRLGGDTVVAINLIEAGVSRWQAKLAEAHALFGAHLAPWQALNKLGIGRLELGVDVARFGDDDSTSAARRGDVAIEIKSRGGFDTVETAGMVLDQIRRLRIKGDQIPLVKVDTIGNGAGVADILRDAKDEHGDPICQVLDVNVSTVSDEPEEYTLLRDQLWFGIGEWLEEGGAIPGDEDLDGERDLLGELGTKYGFDGKGRRLVEQKKTFKKRLGRSPDRADALALSIYSPYVTDDRTDEERRAEEARLHAMASRYSGMRGFG